MKKLVIALICFLPLFAMAQSSKTTTQAPQEGTAMGSDTTVNRTLCYLLVETNPPLGKTSWVEGLLIVASARDKAIGQIVLIKNKKEKDPNKQYREVKQTEIVHAISPVQYLK